MTVLDKALGSLLKAGGSDLLFRANAPIYFRIANKLVRQDLPFPTEEELERALRVVAGNDRLAELHRTGETSTLHRAGDGNRFRVSAFRQRGTPALVVRHMPSSAPPISDLGLPEIFMGLPRLRRGLVVICGTAGSGKTTTLASILNDLIQQGPIRILTLENPIEFRAPPGVALVSQREVGRDVETFETGLRAARHQDPDVVLIGEVPDTAALEQALTLASTGPLVYMVVTAVSVTRALERLLEYFPADRREVVLERLATSLRAVLGQHLLTSTDGVSRVPAFELLIPDQEIRARIRKGDLATLPSLLEKSRGSVPLRQSVGLMLKSKSIPLEEAQHLFPSLRQKSGS